MNKKECFVPVESIGIIVRCDEKQVGVVNRSGSYDYALPINSAMTLREKLAGITNYQEALAIIEANK